MSRHAPAMLSAAATLAILPHANAQGIRVIYSNIATSATSDVPGLAPAKFNLGTGTQFDRPFISASGRYWIFAGATNLAATENEVVIAGNGRDNASAVAFVVAREGTPTGFDGSVNYGLFDTQMGINNDAFYAFGADTTYPTASDECVVSGTLLPPIGYTLISREGNQAPGQSAGVGYGSTSNAVHVTNDNRVGFRTAALVTATTQQVNYLDSTIVAQTDATTPAGQLTAPDQSIDNLTSDRYRHSHNGMHSIYHADLNGPTTTDLVMVVDGTVRAQEGSVLPASGFVSNVTVMSADAGSQHVGVDGSYIFRGNNADAIDWVYHSGAVAARTDAPITSAMGETELFDDAIFTTTFFNNAINNVGDYLIGGVTNAADITRNAVLVLNGEEVAIREGDPVDVDGNGMNDDDAFVSVFNNDDSVLTDDLKYYFNADLRNAAGTSIGQARFLFIDLNPRCVADVDDGSGTGMPDGGVTIDDLLYYLFIFENGDVAADVDDGSFTGTPDGGVTIDDLLYYIFRFENGC